MTGRRGFFAQALGLVTGLVMTKVVTKEPDLGMMGDLKGNRYPSGPRLYGFKAGSGKEIVRSLEKNRPHEAIHRQLVEMLRGNR